MDDRLTPEDIEEFRQIVLKTTGQELTTQEAWNRAFELINLYRLLMKVRRDDEELDNPQYE